VALALLGVQRRREAPDQVRLAGAKDIRVAERHRLADPAPVLADQQARAPLAEEAQVGVDAVAHVQVGLAIEADLRQIERRVDDLEAKR
jgi:hypothetical protein